MREQVRYIYLGGPIDQRESISEARYTWRPQLSQLLRPHLLPLSPLRRNRNGDPREIAHFCMQDIRLCDAMVANFLPGPTEGTWIEVGYALALGRPVFAIGTRNFMVVTHATAICASLRECAETLNMHFSAGI